MLKNYIKLAFRNLMKQKMFSLINIFGLSVGIAVTVLFFLFIRSELTFDAFHESAGDIYRVNGYFYHPDKGEWSGDGFTPIPLGPALLEENSGIRNVIRFNEENSFVRYGDKTFNENIIFAGRDFFKVFDIELSSGDEDNVLSDPLSAVLSERYAEKYFGEENPIGKRISVLLDDEYKDLTVTGVAEKIPDNTAFQFNILLPYNTLSNYEWFSSRIDSWLSFNSATYIRLAKGTSPAVAEEKLDMLAEKYYGAAVGRWRAEGVFKEDFLPIDFKLQPLKDIHLDTELTSSMFESSDPVYSYILAIIALIVLIIACINFMNITTGKSVSRATEVAVRKVIGAERKQLMHQFWGEAVITVLIALGIGIAIAELLLPQFNAIIDRNLSINYFSDWSTFAGIIVILIFIAFAAGFYPAFYLSKFRPVNIFRRKIKFGGGNLFSQSLTVGQFALAVFMIFAAIIITQQLDHMRNLNLGFDKEQLLVIKADQNNVNGTRMMELFKDNFNDHPEIKNISGAAFTFGNERWHRVGFRTSENVQRIAYEFRVDMDYLKTMGMELTAGRNFSPNLPTDSTNSVIVNEALVKEFGLTDPVGKVLDGFERDAIKDPYIIGVVKNYNFRPLYQQVEPVILHLNAERPIDYIFVRVRAENFRDVISELQQNWEKAVPQLPFQFSFMDEDVDSQYRREEKWHSIIQFAGGFSIIIAILGLFGLTAISLAGRIKEIGIRKVLGATVPDITVHLIKNFLILVFTGNLIAWPAGWYFADKWLQGFAYSTGISIWHFIFAGLISVVISALTIGVLALRAAGSNPVNALRYE